MNKKISILKDAETEAEVERKAREEALRPDKEKILTYMGNLLNVELPKIKDNDTREILKMFHDELNALVFKYKRLVKE